MILLRALHIILSNVKNSVGQFSNNRIIIFCKALFTPLAIVFLTVALWHARQDISIYLIKFDHVSLLLSILVWSCTHLTAPLFVSLVMKACCYNVSYLDALKLHVVNLPARYIPGGIWHTVGRVGGLHKLGVSARVISTFVILENVLSPGVTLVLGGLIVGNYHSVSAWKYVAYGISSVGFFVLLVSPYFVNSILLREIKRKISFKSYFNILLIIVLFWTTATISFLFYLSSIPNYLMYTTWVEVAGSYLFSWGVGFLAFFAPQGLGVFELVAANTMSVEHPVGSIVALLAGFRLVVLFADLFVWLSWGGVSWLSSPRK